MGRVYAEVLLVNGTCLCVVNTHKITNFCGKY